MPPYFFIKVCVLKNNSKDDTIVVDHFCAKGDFHRNRPCILKHLAIHLGIGMATGRVGAGTVFALPRTCPSPRHLPSRECARGQKSLPVPMLDGYPRVSGNPQPVGASLAVGCIEVGCGFRRRCTGRLAGLWRGGRWRVGRPWPR
jgi:hypothetical protein